MTLSAAIPATMASVAMDSIYIEFIFLMQIIGKMNCIACLIPPLEMVEASPVVQSLTSNLFVRLESILAAHSSNVAAILTPR